MTTDPEPGNFRRFVRPFALGGLVLALAACGGSSSNNGPGPFDELLFVTDTIAVTSYSVSNGAATERDTALIPGIPGTYTRTGNLVTVTITNHSVPDGYWVSLDFSPGTGGTAADGNYVATVVDDDTFTVTTAASGTITNGTLLQSPFVELPGTYVQAGTTVTVTLPDHGLGASDIVTLFYASGAAVDGEFPIDTVPDADTFTIVAPAALNTSGDVDVYIGGDYTIFGMAMHPNGRWLYVTSTYAYDGEEYQWGSDMISRFAIDWDTGNLTFEESYRTTDDAIEEISEPAPVTLVFSPDGTQLVHQDDSLDGLWLWDVDAVTGDLALAGNSGVNTTGQHGIVFYDSTDGLRVYHGTWVFSVGASSLTRGGIGQAGESNQIIGNTMFSIFGGRDGVIRAFSLSDPDLPDELAESDSTPHHARDLALFDNGALIVSSGFGGLKSYTYDGEFIEPAVGAGSTEFRDGGAPFPININNEVSRVYRTISRNAAGNLVASAYFTNKPNEGFGGPPSGFILMGVAADGTLTLLQDYETDNYARVARFFQKP